MPAAPLSELSARPTSGSAELMVYEALETKLGSVVDCVSKALTVTLLENTNGPGYAGEEVVGDGGPVSDPRRDGATAPPRCGPGPVA